MNRVEENNLPKLPFEKILSYLGLENQGENGFKTVASSTALKCQVSVIRSPKILDRPFGLIVGKPLFVSGARNFISLLRNQVVRLPSLKHPRMCVNRTVCEAEDKKSVRTLETFREPGNHIWCTLEFSGSKRLKSKFPIHLI